jgi:formylglycine-generating enzyme required for sulfatase activity
MGASHTYIAKPWRHEVYIQGATFPHPVLSHELAHVIAGSFARGPFRVAGPLGGVWPDPGRIEGFAVAAAPDETDELTVMEWAASMQRLGILPPLSAVFQLDFLSITASKAYTVAGAFVTFLRERYGAAPLRLWYGGADARTAFAGKDLPALERDFRAALAALVVPERALLKAKVRFEQPAFFARHCPRIVDRAVGDASQLLGAGDVKGAEDAYRSALALEPNNVDARFGLAGCARGRGDAEQASKLYLALSRAIDLPKLEAAHALETAADMELSRGNGPRASELYTSALDAVFDEDHRRTLEVKRLAAEGPGGRAVVALLVGDGVLAPGWAFAAPALQAWADAESNDVPLYLIGRNLQILGRYAEAVKYLDRSLALRPQLASVRREALRLRLVIGCALGSDSSRSTLVAQALADPDLPKARRIGLERLLERCPAERSGVVPTSVAVPAAAPVTPTQPTKPGARSPECPAGMVRVPGGEFWVGSEPNEGFADDESPRYRTELAPFCVGETEVTAGDYLGCVQAGACAEPARHGILCNFGRPERANHPINCVTWHDAEKYCAAQAGRLPSEAELEYVARGGEQYLKYPWGEASPDEHACWKHPGTCPVKSYPPGAFGLSDVSGNVWEWGADWYGPYPWPPSDGSAKVYRGGSFSRRFEKWMHTRLRNRMRPDDSGAHLGFRCAATLASASCPFGAKVNGFCPAGVL